MISFIFPAYNEGENLKRFPTEVFPVFDALHEPYEIIVIDDGSKDDTAAVVSGLEERIRLVKHEHNQGLGAAVRTGIKQAKGDIVITMDTDLTFAPSLVSKLLERFKQGDVDVVSGSPKLAGYDKDIPFYRIVVSYVASAVYAVVMGKWMRDVSPIFRLYKREQLVTLPLQTNRFEINAEILFYLIRDGRRIVEIPTPLTQRIHGESKLDYRKEIIRHLKLVSRMIRMRLAPAELVWWFSLPVLATLVTWLPYWIWGSTQISPPSVFDSYIYFHWLGALRLGYDTGSQFQWLTGAFVILNRILPKTLSIIEFWLVTRWIATVATLWIGAWCVRRWSGLDKWPARLMMCIFWAGLLLTLSFRPGIFSWYWPICSLGATFALIAAEKLDEEKWKIAAGLSFLGILLSSVYPWFFVFVTIWLVVTWSLWTIKRAPRVFWALFLGGTALVLALVPSLTHWFLDAAHSGWLESEQRNGLGFSRMPFLANTVIVMLVWIVLIGSRVRANASRQKFFHLLTAWIVLFFVWFHSPFTGLFTHNDHFSAPVVFLAWMSLAVLWQESRNAALSISKKIGWVAVVFASVFVVYVFAQALRGGTLNFNTYVIHLMGWYSLVAAGVLIVISSHWSEKKKIWLLLPAILFGFMGWITVVISGASAMSNIKTRGPEIDWMKQHVSVPQTLCAEPDAAAFYGAHTGYPVLPGEGPIAYPITNETVMRQLEAIIGSLDVHAAKEESVFEFFAYYYTNRVCLQFSRQASLLQKLGYSKEQTDKIIGCPTGDINAEILRIDTAIQKHQLDEKVFTQFCPFVIVDPGHRDLWHLPTLYQQVTFPDGGSIWRKP